MGVNLFTGSTVIADNREPETISADYSEAAALTGALVWPLIASATEVEGDANLKCHSKGCGLFDVTVMVCR